MKNIFSIKLIILLKNKILIKTKKKITIQYKIFVNIIKIYLHNISKIS